MKYPVWAKPAASGAVVGAAVVALLGFTMGGWTTAGNAEELARQQSMSAVVTALTPYCLERARNDPNSVALIAELIAAPGTSRLGLVEKAGWATPLGTEAPHRELARACQLALTAPAA